MVLPRLGRKASSVIPFVFAGVGKQPGSGHKDLCFQQLERAIAVVDRANVKEHQGTLLGPVLNAIVSNME